MKSWIKVVGGAALLAGLTGCNGEDNNPPSDFVSEAEAAMTARVSVAGLLVGYAEAPALLAYLAQAPAQSDSLYGLTCPVVDVSPVLSVTEVILSYGSEGCTSQLDDVVHKGTVAIGKPQNLATLQFHFTNYAIGDYVVTDGLDGSYNQNNVTLDFTDFYLSGSDGISVLDGSFEGAWNAGGTLHNLVDDAWTITGTDVITATDQKIYLFDIDNNDPLALRAGCAWPVSGTANAYVVLPGTGSDVSDATRIDFGDGACDDLARVTVGSTTRTIHLTTGQE